MVLLASKLPTWRQALLIVQPDTLLRWHRELFKHFWARQSKRKGGNHRLSDEVIALIQRMARENRLWGAERLRGELRILGWRVGKGTILKYLHQVRPPRPPSQTWKTFLHNHAEDIWACDFIQVADVWFRSLFAFVIVELGSRRVVHIGVTRHPTDEWVAQQLREATPFDEGPKHLIRDNDPKYGPHFAAVAAGAQIEVIKTPFRAPRANAICERFIGSVRRECLNHLLIRDERHLFRLLKAYIHYFNSCRPHQGIGQRLPQPQPEEASMPQNGPLVARPILGGLHHHYYRAAA
jgi:transposase InsO family protein